MRVAILDTLAIPVGELSTLVCCPDVLKVIHDLSFDARILSSNGMRICSVSDTAVAAVFLGKPGTGLAALLAAELGLTVDKGIQNSDWARRPLSEKSIAYLAADVSHLLRLQELLMDQVRSAGIEDEVAYETAYRLVEALHAPDHEPVPFAKVRGANKLDQTGQRILEQLANMREARAVQINLPPQRVLADWIVVDIAQRKPQRRAEFVRYRQVARLDGLYQEEIIAVVKKAIAETLHSTTELSPAVSPPKSRTNLPTGDKSGRKAVEKRLRAWRTEEAARRSLCEQVVLPSHCIRNIIAHPPKTIEEVALIPGFGTRRTELYANKLLEITATQ